MSTQRDRNRDRNRSAASNDTHGFMGDLTKLSNYGNVDVATAIRIKETELLQASDPEPQYMYLLAALYAHGDYGIKLDYKKSQFWLEKASKAGFAPAMCDLAAMYMNGHIELKKEDAQAEAFRLFRKAARHKIGIASSNVGECYYQGIGVEKNYEEALRWYKKALAQGDESAYYCIGRCYLDGKGVEKNYKTAMRYMHKAYDCGIGRAAFQIGNCYLTGFGVDIDVEKAIEWYQKAADLNEPRAYLILGKFYLEGKGVEKNEEKGWSLIEKAAYGNVDGDIEEAKTLLEKRDADKKNEESSRK